MAPPAGCLAGACLSLTVIKQTGLPPLPQTPLLHTWNLPLIFGQPRRFGAKGLHVHAEATPATLREASLPFVTLTRGVRPPSGDCWVPRTKSCFQGLAKFKPSSGNPRRTRPWVEPARKDGRCPLAGRCPAHAAAARVHHVAGGGPGFQLSFSGRENQHLKQAVTLLLDAALLTHPAAS